MRAGMRNKEFCLCGITVSLTDKIMVSTVFSVAMEGIATLRVAVFHRHRDVIFPIRKIHSKWGVGKEQGGGTSIHSVNAFLTGSFDHLDRPLTPGHGHVLPRANTFVHSQFEAPVKKPRC